MKIYEVLDCWCRQQVEQKNSPLRRGVQSCCMGKKRSEVDPSTGTTKKQGNDYYWIGAGALLLSFSWCLTLWAVHRC